MVSVLFLWCFLWSRFYVLPILDSCHYLFCDYFRTKPAPIMPYPNLPYPTTLGHSLPPIVSMADGAQLQLPLSPARWQGLRLPC